MGSNPVVVLTPSFDQHPGLLQRVEDLLVQQKLEDWTKRWRSAARLRDFVAAAAIWLRESDEVTPEAIGRIEWAERQAESADPLSDPGFVQEVGQLMAAAREPAGV